MTPETADFPPNVYTIWAENMSPAEEDFHYYHLKLNVLLGGVSKFVVLYFQLHQKCRKSVT